MKQTLLLLAILFVGPLQAQIVNIPDTNFKNYLLALPGLDANGDNELQVSEAQNWTTELTVIESDLTGPITSLEGLQSFSNTEVFHISASITELDVSGLSNLLILTVNAGTLVNLNTTGLNSLMYFYIYSAAITELDVSHLHNLNDLLVNSAPLGSITIGNLPSLDSFVFTANSLTEMDFSGCTNLVYFNGVVDISNHDVYINLKNGTEDPYPEYIINTVGESSYKCYLCIDETELDDLQNIDTNVMLSTYCTSTPGGNYNTINGSLFYDDEADGCDANDLIIGNIKLDINNGTNIETAISTTGLYGFFTQAGTFTVTPRINSAAFTSNPPFAEVNFAEADNLAAVQNFCLAPNGNHPDLDIVIVPYGAKPGFDADYKIIYRNKGNQMLSGDVVLNYQDDVLDLLWANPSENASAAGTLTWHYNNLAPFQQREIYFEMSVNGPMETPPVHMNDILPFGASITPVEGDDTPDDNTFVLNQVVVGSFDPNDITCLEGSRVHPDNIGEFLHYNINFENTGTAPATFIVVEDVIDPAQFDINSLELINASHPMQASITGNKVVFRFDDIQLGPQEKGSITFRIKTLNTLQVNDDVTQQANIFFDYNWPIETNEATTVFEVLSRGDFEQDSSVKVYPNPSNGVFNISAASEIKSVELYDMQGRLLQAGDSSTLDISGRAAGLYFVKVLTENGTKVEKIVKE